MTAALLTVQEGAITGYDGQTMFEVTRSVVERGAFDVSEEFNTLPGADGRPYSRYGLGLSLVSAIPYIAVRPAARATDQPDKILEAAVASAMAFITAALVVAAYLLARRIGADVRAALLVAAGTVAGTYLLPYSKEFFAEPLTALCIVVTTERLVAGRLGWAGLALGAAVIVRPQSLLFMPVVLSTAWLCHGFPAALRTAAGAAPGLLTTFGYNIVRFGHPLRFGYEDVGFTTPLLTGLGGLAFEPTKSVFVFAPIVVLIPFSLWRLWRSHRQAFVLIAANLGISVGTVAMWFAWHGGWCWGPRLIIPGLVPAIVSIGPWLVGPGRRATAAVLFALGLSVSLPAVFVSTQAQQLEVPPVPREGHFLPTQPLASPSPWRQLQLVGPTIRYSLAHGYQGMEDGRNYLRYVSLWQVGMTRRLQRTGLLVSLVLTLVLFVVVLISGRRLHKAITEANRTASPSRVAGKPPMG